MCDARRVFASVVVVLCLAPAALWGQDPAVERERLGARIDSLVTADSIASAAWERAREARRLRAAQMEMPKLDTQRVGPLTVVSLPSAAAVARRTTEEAMATYRELGVSAAALDSTVFLVEFGTSLDGFEAMATRPQHRRIWLPRWRPHEWRRAVVEREIGRMIAADLPADFGEWLGRQGVWASDPSLQAETYRRLASSSSPATNACRAGDLEGCARALGLVDPGTSWERWYTADQLVEWAAEAARTGYGAEPLRERCERERTLEPCLAYARARGGPPAPLPANARASFLAHALETGGPGAWTRLLEGDAGSIEDRLMRAANAERDAILAGWRREVLAARPQHAAGLGGTWIATLFWFVVIATFAMRSTRWRLG